MKGTSLGRSNPLLLAAATIALLAAGGCVRAHYLVKMNHDGSGTIIETITVLPRALRLIEGHKKRTGEDIGQLLLLSEQAVEERAKSFGDVKVMEKKISDLPDGSKQIRVVYSFKDVNKVHLWMVPTLKCQNPSADGKMTFKYQRVLYVRWRKRYEQTDLLSIGYPQPALKRHYSAPAVIQDYRRITPLFDDMLKDFEFKVEIEAPKDIETFEDRREMVSENLWIDKNRVIPYYISGRNLVSNPEIVRMFLMAEVNAEVHPFRMEWKRIVERAIPHTITPYGSSYRGISVRFIRAPRAVKGPGKK